MIARTILFACVVSLSACTKDEPEALAPRSVAAPEPRHGTGADTAARAGAASPLHANMEEHYVKAQQMKRAVIRGDLAAFRAAASFVAGNEISPDAPKNWQPHADSMRAAARRASTAENLEAASTALAELGASCADCHRDLGAPKLDPRELPESRGVSGHMLRHQWAADRMWDGLVTASVKIWVNGAELMAEAPLAAEDVAPETPELELIARRVHFQANKARLLEEREWPRAYAEFLMSCSACHEKTGVVVPSHLP